MYQVTCPKPPTYLFLFALFLTLINNAFRSSFRYLLIILFQSKLKSHQLTRSYIYPFAFKQGVQEGFRSLLYLVSFFPLYCWKANIFTAQREKGRSYSQLDPFFSVDQSQKYFEVYPKQFVECVSSSSSRSRD